jgi:hypothetical protein
MEFLEKNIKWLQERIMEHKEHYLIIDMPGTTNIV